MSRKAFTLIELIIIIVLVGIIGIYVAPKISTKGYKEKTEATRFMTHVRYAQHKAMISGGMWGIEITGKSYKLLDNTTVEKFPDTEDTNIDIEKNLTLTNSEITDNKIYFNFLGQPQKSDRSLITQETYVNINGNTIILSPRAGGIYFK